MAKAKKSKAPVKMSTLLRKGDSVMITTGGNGTTRDNKGKIGKVLKFIGSERVIIEGLNMVVRHQKATSPEKPAGKISKEAPIHISNVMFYVEKLKRPVRLKSKILADGKKVRGFLNPESKTFEEIAANVPA